MPNIYQEVYGQGKPIVLIHGWAMHSGIWREFAQQLAKQYQVNLVDLPGHGLSESVEPYTLEQISEALFNSLPDSPCCLLGWSLGASVALVMAKNFPQRVNAVILLAGNPKFVEDKAWAGMQSKLLAEFANNLSVDAQLTVKHFLSLQLANLATGKILLKKLKALMNECDIPNETVLQSGLDILKQADLRENLISIHCPVNIIQGDKDNLIPLQAAFDMKKIQAACKLNIIAEAGHIPFLSHPLQVIKAINNFL